MYHWLQHFERLSLHYRDDALEIELCVWHEKIQAHGDYHHGHQKGPEIKTLAQGNWATITHQNEQNKSEL